MGKSRADFDASYDAFEFRREYDKYGPCEAAFTIWQASRKQALEEAAEEADSFADDYMAQARGGDNSGASDHKADAAEQIADAIRSLEGDATKETK
ncbi:MAG: hypothetical protein ACRYGA_02275 [Janthinobacterium lividum]